MTLHLVPARFREAAAFVQDWHRHHAPPPGQIFAIGAADEDGVLRAIAIKPLSKSHAHAVTEPGTRIRSVVSLVVV
ncbi:hypothetical protein GCM10023084_82590 [Streptomyces lacrimifluminis]|uniref:Uncharacterized protein n=1 Tax=Streptomyces lacrimifluminis TaxID=1500077 RepID=A0A917UP93_9ACTN|nr:hypothetical protein GCM10012282_81190 [Streptomyces lacrimifluminis]